MSGRPYASSVASASAIATSPRSASARRPPRRRAARSTSAAPTPLAATSASGGTKRGDGGVEAGRGAGDGHAPARRGRRPRAAEAPNGRSSAWPPARARADRPAHSSTSARTSSAGRSGSRTGAPGIAEHDLGDVPVRGRETAPPARSGRARAAGRVDDGPATRVGEQRRHRRHHLLRIDVADDRHDQAAKPGSDGGSDRGGARAPSAASEAALPSGSRRKGWPGQSASRNRRRAAPAGSPSAARARLTTTRRLPSTSPAGKLGRSRQSARRPAPRPGGRQELSAQPEVTAVGETGQGATERLHFGRDLGRRPGARPAIEERGDERAGAVRRRVLRPRAPGPGRLDGHDRARPIAQHEDPHAGRRDRADDIAAALPRGHGRARGRLVVPCCRAGDDRLQPGRLAPEAAAGAMPGSSTASGERLGTQQPGGRRAQRRRIDRFQALAVATIVVVIVGDGGTRSRAAAPAPRRHRPRGRDRSPEGPRTPGRARRRGPGRAPSRSTSSIAACGGGLDPLRRGRQHQLEQRAAARPKRQPVHGSDDLPVVGQLAGEAGVVPRVSNAAIRSSAAASSTRGAGTRNPSATWASRPDAVDRRARGADDDGGAATACGGERPRGTAANARATASRGGTRVDVSHHDDRHVRPQVGLGEMGRQRLSRERRHGLGLAEQGAAVGVAGKGAGAQHLAGRPGRIDGVAGASRRPPASWRAPARPRRRSAP